MLLLVKSQHLTAHGLAITIYREENILLYKVMKTFYSYGEFMTQFLSRIGKKQDMFFLLFRITLIIHMNSPELSVPG